MNADVVVVGAGPGGASTAYFLAQQGHRVLLLDKQSFPRDKSCGDGVTRAGARLLLELGLLDQFDHAQVVRGARVHLRGRGSRDFVYPQGLGSPDHGLVVPRLILDNELCKQAVRAGAELWEQCTATQLLWEGNAVSGVEILRAGLREKLLVPVVVAADGAASRLARQAELVSTPPDELGFAIRGYYDNLHDLSNLLEIYMPLVDPSAHALLPSYGWVFPTGARSANIGVGLFQRIAGVNVRDLMGQFLSFLQENDARFRDMRPRGKWRGAPLRFDFHPERCVRPGLALVGDAAGMISPFTGEGISYALESGKLAAQVIGEALAVAREAGGSTHGLDLSAYAQLLGRHYVGYFEAGRQSARRYLLLWRVLESTFHNEKPLFAMCRQAALFPEGLGESYATAMLDDVSELMGETRPALAADLLAINEALADTVRHDWPFLVRMVAADMRRQGIPFRPALLLCLAAHAGHPHRGALHLAGAAIEQGYLAALAQLSVEESASASSQAKTGDEANWGNMFAIMVGDFLMSRAFTLSAQIGVGASRDIAVALSRASEGQVRELREAYNRKLSTAEHLDVLERKIATLFELPCRLGARLGGLPPAQVSALAAYGRYLGLAYQLIEDCRFFTAQSGEQTWPILSDPRRGIYSLPLLFALKNGQREDIVNLLGRISRDETVMESLAYSVRQSGALQQTQAIVLENVERARDALKSLPEHAARLALQQLATFVVERGAAVT